MGPWPTVPELEGRTLGEALLEPTRDLRPLASPARAGGQDQGPRAHHRRRTSRKYPAGSCPMTAMLSSTRAVGNYRRSSSYLQAGWSHRAEEMARTFNCGIGMAVIVCAGRSRLCCERSRWCRRIGRSRSAGSKTARAAAPSAAQLAPGARPRIGPPPTMRDPKRVAILISGRGSNMRALVERADGYEVALVASNKPHAAGLDWARERGASRPGRWRARASTRKQFDRALSEALDRHGVGTIALAGFMRILSPWFVEEWRGRIVNIHPSLLPKYRGLDTHARALEAGDLVSRLLGPCRHRGTRRRRSARSGRSADRDQRHAASARSARACRRACAISASLNEFVRR